VNTILKMAKKRALVDAVLNTTGASQFFTQDMEDFKAPPPQPTPAPPHGTRAAQQAVAERKIAELREQIERKPVARAFPPAATAWTTRGQMREVFSKLREIVGEVEFHKEMAAAGVESPGDFQNGDAHRARTCYSRLVAIAQQEVA